MTKELFPSGTSEESKKRLTDLAIQVFGTDQITKENIMFLVTTDMGMSFNKITVSAGQTRPTNIKFATNNYHASIEINLSDITNNIKNILANTPEKDVVEKYLELKAAVYGMLKVKYESTDRYLRGLLDGAAKRDGCPITGDSN